MAISERDAERLNESMPVANDIKLGDIIKALQEGESGPVSVAWADVTGKPATFPPTLGTTASTAAAGNHTHAASAVSTAAITGVTGTNVQAVLAELAGRITALESAGG